MDFLFEESKEDRLIEDYLFSGYKNLSGKSAFEADQQFAKPIQDEDLFGCDLNEEPKECSSDDKQLSDAGSEADVVFGRLLNNDYDGNEKFEERPFEEDDSDALGSNFQHDPYEEKDELVPTSNSKPSNASMIDDIFIDDYSSPALETRPRLNYSTSKAQQHRGANNENAIPEALITKEIEGLTRVAKLKEKILQQAKAIGKPNKLGSGFGEDDEIELSAEPVKANDGNNIFKKLINRSTNPNGTPEKVKRSWDEEKDLLIKRICADKRKVWDSFQRPIDEFDEDVLDEEAESEREKPLEVEASKGNDSMVEPLEEAGSTFSANEESSSPASELQDDSSLESDDEAKLDSDELEEDADELEEDADEHEVQRNRSKIVDEESDDGYFPPESNDENFSRLPTRLDDDDCQSSESSL